MTTTDTYPRAYLYRRIVAAKLFIDEHYAEAIDVDTISNEACLSKFHFIRVFREVYGRTPHDQLVHRRMERAMHLMGEGASAVEACNAVGFTSASSFGRSFKRATGRTPAAFRRTVLDRRREVRAEPLACVPDCFASAHGWKAE